jgi:hypothetical protein
MKTCPTDSESPCGCYRGVEGGKKNSPTWGSNPQPQDDWSNERLEVLRATIAPAGLDYYKLKLARLYSFGQSTRAPLPIIYVVTADHPWLFKPVQTP